MEENNRYTEQDDRLRSLLADAEEAPSAGVWEKIVRRLDNPDKGRRVFFRIFCFVLLLMSAAGGFYFNNTMTLKTTPLPPVTSTSLPVKKNEFHPSDNQTKPHYEMTPSSKNKSTMPSGSARKSGLHKIVASKGMSSNTALSVLSRHRSTTEQIIPNKKSSLSETENKNSEPRPPHFSPMHIPEPGTSEMNDTFPLEVDSFLRETKQEQTFDGLRVFSDIARAKSQPDTDRPGAAEDGRKAGMVNTDAVTILLADTATHHPDLAPILKHPTQFRNSLSLYVAPEYAKNSSADYSGQSISDEIQIPRYSSGITYRRSVLKHVSVRFGIAYSEFHQKLNEHKITFSRFITQPFIFHSSLGEMPVHPDIMREGYDPPLPNFPTKFSFMYTYYQTARFIILPFEAVVHATIKHVTLSCIGGIQSQFVIRQHATLSLLKENQTTTVSYSTLHMKTVSVAATAGLRAEYMLFGKYQIFVEPHARLNLTPLNSNSYTTSTPFFSGLSIGLAGSF